MSDNNAGTTTATTEANANPIGFVPAAIGAGKAFVYGLTHILGSLVVNPDKTLRALGEAELESTDEDGDDE